MRFKETKDDLKLYVVSGTTTVLLSFDIDLEKLENKPFLGFHIERKDANGKITFHNGSKHFESLVKDPTVQDHKTKYLSLVQSFFWYDYTVLPQQEYTYTVKAIFGAPINHEALFSAEIAIATAPLKHGKHSVYFNYGVTGSQAYARNKEFHNQRIADLSGQTLDDALHFLGRELWTDGLLKFVSKANGPGYKLYCAFYEFQYPEFLDAVRKSRESGSDVQIVYSAKPDQRDDRTSHGKIKKGNLSMLREYGLEEVSHPRTKPSQPHNKFMILFEGEQPKEVWTGSTNISTAGIFGQCNTGHWIDDPEIAQQYYTYWKELKTDPAMSLLSGISENVQPDADLKTLPAGSYVFFSPRNLPKVKDNPPEQLAQYASLIESAKEMVCMVLPFNLDDQFKTVYQQDKSYLRFLIFEQFAESLAVRSNDTDLKITAGAILDSKVEEWAEEVSSGTVAEAGILYVHNKFFIVDALSDEPVVVTGSANFSKNSIWNNDENTLLIKGDKRVADIYLTEFNRLFLHFWPRYLRKLNNYEGKVGFEKPLDETYSWFGNYFIPEKFGSKRREMFRDMKI